MARRSRLTRPLAGEVLVVVVEEVVAVGAVVEEVGEAAEVCGVCHWF